MTVYRYKQTPNVWQVTEKEESISDKDEKYGDINEGCNVYELYLENIPKRSTRGYDKNRNYEREITYYGVTDNPKQRYMSHQAVGYILHENLTRAEALYLEALYAWRYEQKYGYTPREMRDR